MHASVASFVAQAIETHGPFTSVLDIGGRNVNGSVRSLFGPVPSYMAIDLAPGPGVDVVADGTQWTNATQVDCVICTSVFEHCADWRKIVQNAYDELAIGGWLIVTAPGLAFPPHSGIDGCELREGEWYQGITPGRLLGALHGSGFEIVMCECNPMDSMAVGVKL